MNKQEVEALCNLYIVIDGYKENCCFSDFLTKHLKDLQLVILNILRKNIEE